MARTPEQRQRIERAALETWGYPTQVLKLMEECGELLAVVGHYIWARATKEDVLAEIADVRIVLDQLMLMIEKTPEELEEKIDEKLDKLDDQILRFDIPTF